MTHLILQKLLSFAVNSCINHRFFTFIVKYNELIGTKFGTVDYVREGTPYTKFGTNPPTEGLWANG